MAADIIMADTIVADIITTMDTDTEEVTITTEDTDTIMDAATGHRWDTMVIIKTKTNTRTDTAIRKTETIAMMETGTTRTRETEKIQTELTEITAIIRIDAIQIPVTETITTELEVIRIEVEAEMSGHIIHAHDDKDLNV